MRKNIAVRALMQPTGRVMPLEIEWDDGRHFAIDKVLDIRKAASLKGGGMGLRYTCRICGQIKYLFLDNYIWFVEVD